MIRFLSVQVMVFVCCAIVQVFSVDYCADKSCGRRGIHTMCKYPPDKVVCSEIAVMVGVSDELRAVILQRHNELRRRVALGKQAPQPPASDMLQLSWSKDAESVAQRWANQCDFKHDQCRNIGRQWTGQNLAIETMTVSSSYRLGLDISSVASPNRSEIVAGLIDKWFGEVEEFNKNRVDSFKRSEHGEVVGHYTQMVWAKTSAVGCGYIETAFQPDEYTIESSYYLVCDYTPGGNMLDDPVYKKGASCSACPLATECSKTYPGLCASDKRDLSKTKNDSPRTNTYYLPLYKRGNRCIVCPPQTQCSRSYPALCTTDKSDFLATESSDEDEAEDVLLVKRDNADTLQRLVNDLDTSDDGEDDRAAVVVDSDENSDDGEDKNDENSGDDDDSDNETPMP